MSDPKDGDRKPDEPAKGDTERRPSGSGAGRSGTAGSIGKELGGDLDFEPDALLDTLLSDDHPETKTPTVARRAVRRPTGGFQPAGPESKPGRKLHEPQRRMYPADEVTVVSKGGKAVAPPAVDEHDLPLIGVQPGETAYQADDSSDVDQLLAESHDAKPAPPDAPPQPATPPVPVAAPPRRLPPDVHPTGTAKPPAVNPAGPARREPFPPAMSPAAPPTSPQPEAAADSVPPESLDEAQLDALGITDVADDEPAEARESAEPGEEYEDLGAEEFEEMVEDDAEAGGGPEEFHRDEPPTTPLPSRPPVDLSRQAAQVASRIPLSEPPPRPSWDSITEERPALRHLADQQLSDDWTARAEVIEAEAHALEDAQRKARALLVASELRAMLGDTPRARALANEAVRAAPTLALAQRQARWLAQAEGDWKTVASALETEARHAPTPEAQAHAAYLGAELARIVIDDEAGTKRKLDVAARALPGDPRAHVAKLIRELAGGTGVPRVRWPDEEILEPLKQAVAELNRLRGGAVSGPPTTTAAIFDAAHRALADKNPQAAAEAIATLSQVDGLERAGRWLAACLLAPSEATRPRAIELLVELAQADPSSEATRRALVARALEQGDPRGVQAALGDEVDAAFGVADRVALGVLTGAESSAVAPWARKLAESGELPALASAALSSSLDPVSREGAVVGDDQSRSELGLGRLLAGPRNQDFAEAFQAFQQLHPENPLCDVLAIEQAIEQKNVNPVASALAHWRGGEADAIEQRNRHLMAALLYEAASDTESATAEYAAALEADPACEAAARALAAAVPDQAARLFEAMADVCVDNAQAALLLTEAALRRGFDEGEQMDHLLNKAAEADPSLPFAHRLGETLGRHTGNTEKLLEWVRRRRDATSDPLEKAFDLVREALFMADEDMALAASLLEEAAAARPEDIALHELHERLAPGTGVERGAWRERAAEQVEDAAASQRLLVAASLEYERAGDFQAAARTAKLALEKGSSERAQVTVERTAVYGENAAQVADELFTRAREETEEVAQRELYQRLSAFDRARGEASSALLWHNAILERTPGFLPSLRHLEHAYISAGRDDELEPIATALAQYLDHNEASAHARLAARLRARSGAWESARDVVERAFRMQDPPLWALRDFSAQARAASDDAGQFEADSALFERSSRAMDAATLALRAAEAATRLQRFDEAKRLLERAVELIPEHLVALTTRAEVLESLGDHHGAAVALEAAAAASQVEAHRATGWQQAAVLWLDNVKDIERGTAALEHSAAIDVTNEEVFKRLQSLYVEAGDRTKLADLLERRLAETSDPDERIALEVTRGRALTEVGDREAAKQALAAALDANPDHAEALDAFAELCTAEGDWSGAEQAWIRLARHVPEPERQVEIYKKLGALYDAELNNAERAELSYKEVLKRVPDDAEANDKLVQVYGRLGRPDDALKLQKELVEKAETPEEKRDRTVGLAFVYETIAKDKKQAEATLEKARKAWGNDPGVLRAVAGFYSRSENTRTLTVLLDRAAADARRALSHGRFDRSFFSVLATVAELKGADEKAAIANSTLSALEGGEAPLPGAGPAAGDARLDDDLAPDLLTLPLRALLRKAGDCLDAAYPVELKTIKASPLPAESAQLVGQIQGVAQAFGLQGLDILVSPTLGMTCMPASAAPPRIVFGEELLAHEDEGARYFLMIRALKILQAGAATLSRTAPVDLWPVVAGFLKVLVPNWEPQGVDKQRVAEEQAKIQQGVRSRLDNDVPTLALEVSSSVGTRASQLGTAVNQWGDRAGLLAVGDPNVALRGIALAAGQKDGPPSEGDDRMKWIMRNAEARDLAVFSVSDAYAEARRKLGL